MQTARRHHPSKEEIQNRHKRPPADVAKHAVRLSSLKKISRAFGDINNFSFAAELTPDRLEALLQGKVPLSNEMVMHLEAALNLEPGWMDDTSSEYGKKQGQQLLSDKKVSEGQEHGQPPSSGGEPTGAAAGRAAPKAAVAALAPAKNGGTPTLPVAKVPVIVKRSRVARPAEPATASPASPTGPGPAQEAVAPVQTPTAALEATPPVKRAVSAKPKNEVLQRVRRMNLSLLTEGQGEKAGLSRKLGIHASQISLKLDGTRVMSDKFCKKLEGAYSLPKGWMDEARLTRPAGVLQLAAVRRGAAAGQSPAGGADATPTGALAPEPAGAGAPPGVREPAAAPLAAAPVSAGAPTPLAMAAFSAASPWARALIELIAHHSAAGQLSDKKIGAILEEIMA